MLVILIFLFIQASFAHDLNNAPNREGSLRVVITGFANDDGNCRFALDNTEYVYESEDSVFVGKVLPIINNTVVIKIDSLQHGYYAVKVFHDENSNEKIDTNFLGIPTEDYGYSNNASAWFGPPSCENAKILFDLKDMTLEISVD